MTIKTCDKCGANIIKNPAANLKLPTFTIFKFGNYLAGFQVIKQLAEEICNQPKAERMKSPVVPLQIQPRIYPDFKRNRKGDNN